MKWFTIPNPLQQQDSPALDDPHELEVSIDGILNLIRNEQKSVRRHQIYIGGHGQGFAVAAAAFLVDGEGDFAGLIGLNGWLPHVSMIQGGSPHNFWRWVSNARALLHPTRFGSLFTRPYPSDDHDIVVPPPSVDHNCGIVQRRTTLGRRRTPIFLAHPHYDSVVDCASSAAASDAFDRMGWVGAGFEDYPHDNGETQSVHWINRPLGVDDLKRWLTDNLTACRNHPRHGHLEEITSRWSGHQHLNGGH